MIRVGTGRIIVGILKRSATMSKLGEKERKELRRRAFELHLQDDRLIAVGHVAIRSAMLDKLIDLTFQQIIQHYPETLRNELDKLSSPKRIKVAFLGGTRPN